MMAYYILDNGTKHKLYKSNNAINIQGQLYAPYCYIENSILSEPVLFIGFIESNEVTMIDNKYKYKIYTRDSCCLIATYSHIVPDYTVYKKYNGEYSTYWNNG